METGGTFPNFHIKLGIMLAVLVFAVGPMAGAASGTAGGSADPLYIFNGQGRAHGVGLCMDGVHYRAREGQSYHQIINYYYTGITYGRTDDNQPIRVKCRDGQIRAYPMHQYLYHLQEEPESSPMEELKVLYVAARTYTLSCIARGKHAREGFDICSSGNCCQAFDENKDLSKYPNNRAAVDATTGETILYAGKPIIAAYCGSCGGHTENNEDVWGGTALPYLRGKPDSYCQNSPRFAWTVAMRKSELEARLNSSGDTSIGQLLALDLSSRTPGGRVRNARLTGTAGVKVVSGTALAARLGFQSSRFDLVPNNFDEYILVLNPNPQPNIVTFTFMQPDGGTSDQIVEIPGNSRYTLKVNDYVQCQEVSTRIVSERPVVAERAMYFNCGGRRGGSASAGAPATSSRWYFAEGYTGGKFDTYILVQNPSTEQADVKLTFMVPGGRTAVKTLHARPCSRVTVHVDEVPGLADAEVSTLVESTNGVGIVADRSMYFDYKGYDDGNSQVGTNAPATRWYLAEGYTGGSFDTYVLMQNPGGTTARVDATFMKEDGTTVKLAYAVAPHSRYTITADQAPGLESAGFSTRLVSTNGVGIIAERAMYFDYNGLTGGSDGMGATAPSPTWYFGEGYTGGQFDTYVLVQNPDSKPAGIRVTFTKPNGKAVVKSYTIKPDSRLTIPVDRVAGLADAEVATTVKSTNGVGVIAERAMYFNYDNGFDQRSGGHDAPGVTTPSTLWYFAEGCTGY
jgi:SpoIID/LytB domain protein